MWECYKTGTDGFLHSEFSRAPVASPDLHRFHTSHKKVVCTIFKAEEVKYVYVYIYIYMCHIFSHQEYKTKHFRMKHTQVGSVWKIKSLLVISDCTSVILYYWQTERWSQGWKGDIHHLNPGSGMVVKPYLPIIKIVF